MRWIIVSGWILASVAYCNDLQVRERDVGVMGTSLELKLWDEDVALLDQTLEDIIAEFRRIEDVMTDWRDSPLMDLNHAAGQGPQTVNAELAAIISRSVEVSRLTHGAFDPTFASAGKLWDFKKVPPLIPSEDDLRRAVASIDAQKVVVDPKTLTVNLPKGMKLGLGGIAKGYAVDQAMALARSRGVKHALISAGGDMKALGLNGGDPWEVAIKHPRDRERALAVLHLSNACLVTSGDYERFFTHDGVRYHHILDPRTGRPATGNMSVSVIGPNAEFTDALATALCVLTVKKGMRLVESLDKIDALFVDMDGVVHTTSGLSDQLKQ